MLKKCLQLMLLSSISFSCKSKPSDAKTASVFFDPKFIFELVCYNQEKEVIVNDKLPEDYDLGFGLKTLDEGHLFRYEPENEIVIANKAYVPPATTPVVTDDIPVKVKYKFVSNTRKNARIHFTIDDNESMEIDLKSRDLRFIGEGRLYYNSKELKQKYTCISSVNSHLSNTTPRKVFAKNMATVAPIGPEGTLPPTDKVVLLDTKFKRVGEGLMSEEQLLKMFEKMEPADLIVERRNWFLTNLIFSDYWTHSILYIGDEQTMLKYFTSPDVNAYYQKKLDKDIQNKNIYIPEGFKFNKENVFIDYLKLAMPQAYTYWSQSLDFNDPIRPKDYVPRPFEVYRLLEGVGYVAFSSFSKGDRPDSIAVMRPTLSKLAKAQAIEEGFRYYGYKYKTSFDFDDPSGGMICSEFIARIFKPSLNKDGLNFIFIPLKFGIEGVSPQSFVQNYVDNVNNPKTPLKFVYLSLANEEKNVSQIFEGDKGSEILVRSARFPGGISASINIE